MTDFKNFALVALVASTCMARAGAATESTEAASPPAKSTPRPKVGSSDDLTKAALKRAHKPKAKVATRASQPSPQAEVVTTSDQVGPIITKPVVRSQPAPGMDAAKSTSTATSTATATATATVETTPEKARELLMTSHVPTAEDTRDETTDGAKKEPNEEAHASATASSPPPVVMTKPPASAAEGDSSPAAHATAQAATTSAKADAPQAAVAAESSTSLKWLSNGNIRYVSKNFRSDGRLDRDRDRLTKTGQKPHAIVLSCADSNVPPEIVFDQSLGELYTVRTLGEVTDSATLASLEYAVTYLGPKLLVVMGHTQCDAIQGVLQIREGENAGSEFLNKLLSDIRGHLQTLTSEKHSTHLAVEATLNADGVARDLLRRSELIRKKVEAGELVIKTALYRGDTGKVTFY